MTIVILVAEMCWSLMGQNLLESTKLRRRRRTMWRERGGDMGLTNCLKLVKQKIIADVTFVTVVNHPSVCHQSHGCILKHAGPGGQNKTLAWSFKQTGSSPIRSVSLFKISKSPSFCCAHFLVATKGQVPEGNSPRQFVLPLEAEKQKDTQTPFSLFLVFLLGLFHHTKSSRIREPTNAQDLACC